MKFNVTLIDPSGYKYGFLLSDTCRCIAHGLRSLGHSCDLTVNSLDGDKINIIVGTHLLTPELANGIANLGLQYIPYQTEWLFPSEGLYKVKSSFHGDNFEPTCRTFFEKASAIWESYEHNEKLLARWDIPPTHIKMLPSLGFHEELIDVKHREWAKKDIDVLFFGSITERRAKVLNELGTNYNVVGVLDAPPAFRNDLIARAKINLNLHADERYTHLSISRVCYLLNNQSLVVSEHVTTHPELQELIIGEDYDKVVDRCCSLLKETTKPAFIEISFAKFQQMPISKMLETVLQGQDALCRTA